ncbi:WhiB family transcriptional regulator [Streptomyces sp. NPDC020490]|uniref:WhiB family transcriptional regulator n=1 Tax=Streptomyces sp. NPDC020490 TaxID=3365078 RepID=UPI00378CF8B1
MYAPARHRADTDPWVERAVCRDADPETFFPPAGGTDDSDRETAAKRLCARCPVTRECLREALLHEESTGIWGGLTVRERREVLRVAASLREMPGELAAFLAHGGRRITAPPRERPAYVWFLHRHGWEPGRIAAALGLTFSQVQQAWRAADYASACTRGPVHRMPGFSPAKIPAGRTRTPAARAGAPEAAAAGARDGVRRTGEPATPAVRAPRPVPPGTPTPDGPAADAPVTGTRTPDVRVPKARAAEPDRPRGPRRWVRLGGAAGAGNVRAS